MMKISAWLTWELRDKHGQLKSFSKEPANSIVRSFIDILYMQMSQVTFTNGVIDVLGNTRTISPYAGILAANAAVNIGDFGLVVGTSSTAVAVTNTALISKIAEGTGAGALTHGTVVFTAPTTTGSTRSFTVQRTFTNNSPGSITVNEVGIYVKVSGTPWYVLMDRTLSTKTIGIGTTGTLTYTLGVTV